jgi:ubiquinone/menaquinone biosynthesis C-methylase UbiE
VDSVVTTRADPMATADSRVARGFDRLSPWYDLLVALFPGRRISRSQTIFIDHAATCRRGLIVGGGTGEFLLKLLRSSFDGTVVCLDISRGMLERTRVRLEREAPELAGRVELRVGGVEAIEDDERFDLICTHYFLDLFTDDRLLPVMRRLDRALIPDGRWLCSDFADPTGARLPRALRRGLIRSLYAFFNWACAVEPRSLPSIGRTFSSLNYLADGHRTLASGLIWSAVYSRGE